MYLLWWFTANHALYHLSIFCSQCCCYYFLFLNKPILGVSVRKLPVFLCWIPKLASIVTLPPLRSEMNRNKMDSILRQIQFSTRTQWEVLVHTPHSIFTFSSIDLAKKEMHEVVNNRRRTFLIQDHTNHLHHESCILSFLKERS